MDNTITEIQRLTILLWRKERQTTEWPSAEEEFTTVTRKSVLTTEALTPIHFMKRIIFKNDQKLFLKI